MNALEKLQHDLAFQTLLVQLVKRELVKWETPEPNKIGKRFILSNSISTCFVIGRSDSKSQNYESIFIGGLGPLAECLFKCDIKIVLSSNQFLICINTKMGVFTLRLQVNQEMITTLKQFQREQAIAKGLPPGGADLKITFKEMRAQGVSHDFKVTNSRSIPLIEVYEEAV